MKWDVSDIKNWPARKHEPGATILEAGNTKYYITGDWRSERPVWNSEKCTQCLSCFFFCPDVAIETEDGKVSGIDYDHCKGCGICATECPVDAIEMRPEAEFQGGKS